MGFPVEHMDVLLPQFFLHGFSLLLFIKMLRSSLFRLLGFLHFLQPTNISPPTSTSGHLDEYHNLNSSVSALLLREAVPVVRFSDLEGPTPDSCAVCLDNFISEDQTRKLANCRHVFHMGCLDRSMDYDNRRTCPLCRLPVIPEDVQDAFNERLLLAFGIPELYTAVL